MFEEMGAGRYKAITHELFSAWWEEANSMRYDGAGSVVT